MSIEKDKKIKEKYNVKTGFFEDGLPNARIGNKPDYIVLTNGVIKDQKGSNYPVKDKEMFRDDWELVE